MRDKKGEKVKLSLREAVVASKGMYPRLFSYVKPYKWRFVVGIIFGFLFGILNGLVAPVIAKVANVVFHGAIPNAKTLFKHSELLSAGGKIDSIVWVCLLIPLLMAIRSLLSFGNAYYMNWVSNRVVMDIRNELFGKLLNHSMDFYNKIRTGFLMSRIANDTRSMQMALSTVSSDVFKQPVSILAGIAGLLYVDWRFTLVTLVLLPICLIPIQLFGRRARRAVQDEQKGMVQMTVTMQETFSGIRVIKSFTREEHQEKSFVKSTRQQFSNAMRMVRASEAVGPMVETIASVGIGFALFYVYFAHLPVGKFVGLMIGIFVLYDPIKTLSKLHIVIQRSVGATSKIFALMDSEPSVQDRPGAADLTNVKGSIDFDHVTFRYSTGVSDAVPRPRSENRTRQNLCARGPKRRREIDHSFAAAPTLRSHQRRRSDRWQGLARAYAAIVATTDRPRHPGDVSFSRHHLQKHPVRPARCRAGRNLRSRPDGFRA